MDLQMLQDQRRPNSAASTEEWVHHRSPRRAWRGHGHSNGSPPLPGTAHLSAPGSTGTPRRTGRLGARQSCAHTHTHTRTRTRTKDRVTSISYLLVERGNSSNVLSQLSLYIHTFKYTHKGKGESDYAIIFTCEKHQTLLSIEVKCIHMQSTQNSILVWLYSRQSDSTCYWFSKCSESC